MYESWFRLSKRPFNAPPQTADYFADQGIETAREALLRCIQRNAGPGVVIGEHGSGKSLLSLLLVRQCRSVRKVAHVSAPGIRNRKELLQTILFEFGLPYHLEDEGQLRLSLIDFLTSGDSNQDGTVLLVDDAQELAPELIDQLASLSDLVRDGRWCVTLVLFGLQSLEDQLTRPALASLNQRIAARYYLRSWNRDTTHRYITTQLQQAGVEGNGIFQPEALDAIYEASAGVPRLINQICDHAMILAAVGEKQWITAATIREAWSDLQSLPHDVSTSPMAGHETGDDSVVEFGTLEDSDFTKSVSVQSEPLEFGVAASEQSENDRASDQNTSPLDVACHENCDGHDRQSCASGGQSADDSSMLGTDRTFHAASDHSFQRQPPCGIQPPVERNDIEVGRFEDEAAEVGHVLDVEIGGEADYVIDPELERRLADLQTPSQDEATLNWHATLPAAGPEMGVAPDELLDSIQRQLLSAEEQDGVSQTRSPGHEQPNDVLTNPFLESFDEEEVVISRSAGLDADFVTRQPSVTTDQGGCLTDMLKLLESHWDETNEYAYGTRSEFDDNVVASPEIAAAVAAAVAARDQKALSAQTPDVITERPCDDDLTPEVIDTATKTARSGAIPATDLYDNFDVTASYPTGDRRGEPAYDSTTEPIPDVIIAGPQGPMFICDDGSGNAGVSPDAPHGIPQAANDRRLDPPRDMDNQEDSSSLPPETAKDEPHKRRRFGSLFSGLRDR
jgi:type II secretory pathway predicted ATPase ExeA